MTTSPVSQSQVPLYSSSGPASVRSDCLAAGLRNVEPASPAYPSARNFRRVLNGSTFSPRTNAPVHLRPALAPSANRETSLSRRWLRTTCVLPVRADASPRVSGVDTAACPGGDILRPKQSFRKNWLRSSVMTIPTDAVGPTSSQLDTAGSSGSMSARIGLGSRCERAGPLRAVPVSRNRFRR
ncbi:unnamed protein product [Protopolystoma xenopodis]|uniref:Uncharacterized protein n=1 Tax=Protopolystoma xenopodis TaxID=117903 RepID=A0A448X7C8_9PLAT|nr:unnamed protein product [Protopolystoma xenopodis]